MFRLLSPPAGRPFRTFGSKVEFFNDPHDLTHDAVPAYRSGIGAMRSANIDEQTHHGSPVILGYPWSGKDSASPVPLRTMISRSDMQTTP